MPDCISITYMPCQCAIRGNIYENQNILFYNPSTLSIHFMLFVVKLRSKKTIWEIGFIFGQLRPSGADKFVLLPRGDVVFSSVCSCLLMQSSRSVPISVR